jgi:hypothetical protein
VVREGVRAGGEMTQALYAHMNNKIKKKERRARIDKWDCIKLKKKLQQSKRQPTKWEKIFIFYLFIR